MTFHWHSQLNLKIGKAKLIIFSKKLILKSQKISKNKNRPIIVSFDGFHYQSFVTQATATNCLLSDFHQAKIHG